MSDTETVLDGDKIVEMDIYTGEVVGEHIQRSYPPASPYTPPMGRIVCHLLSLGKTYAIIESELEFSPGTIVRWRGAHPDFREGIDIARKSRAYIFEDKVLELADKDYTTDQDIRAAKFRVDTYAKLAKWGDRETYGDGNNENIGGVTFIVQTGIDRGNRNENGEIIISEVSEKGTTDPGGWDEGTSCDAEADAPDTGDEVEPVRAIEDLPSE